MRSYCLCATFRSSDSPVRHAQAPRTRRLQVLRGQDPLRLRAGHHRRRRAQRLRQEQRRRRRALDPRRAVGQEPARRRDGRRHLQRLRRRARASAWPRSRSRSTTRGGLLAVDADEVQITRRVYRDGKGEYLINGQMARLKDIKDLFLGSGAGAAATASSRRAASTSCCRRPRRTAARSSRRPPASAGSRRRRSRRCASSTAVELNLTRSKDKLDALDNQLRTLRHAGRESPEVQGVFGAPARAARRAGRARVPRPHRRAGGRRGGARGAEGRGVWRDGRGRAAASSARRNSTGR